MADALGTGGAVVSAADHRLDQAGLIAPQSSTLAVRTGILWGPGSTAVVTGTSATGTMTVNVAAHHWVSQRAVGDGVYIGTKETSTTLNIAVAPGTNSRIDVVYSKQNDAGSTITADGSTGELYDVVTGTAAASPVKPALPLGAVEIATVTIAAGTTSTVGAGATISNSGQLTVARGAPIPVRNTTERNALTTYPGLHVVRLDNGGRIERWVSGTTWASYDDTARTRLISVTASGTLASGATVLLIPTQTLPAAPFGAGVPYQLRVSCHVLANVPPGAGAILDVLLNGSALVADQGGNGGTSSASITFRANEVYSISTDVAQTVSVRLAALSGALTITNAGRVVVIEALPMRAL